MSAYTGVYMSDIFHTLAYACTIRNSVTGPLRNVVKCGKYSLANFVYFCIACGNCFSAQMYKICELCKAIFSPHYFIYINITLYIHYYILLLYITIILYLHYFISFFLLSLWLYFSTTFCRFTTFSMFFSSCDDLFASPCIVLKLVYNGNCLLWHTSQ